MHQPVTWVLVDDKAGHAAQACGLTEALGYPHTSKFLRYTKAAALPNMLLGASLKGITRDCQRTMKPPWPDLLIAAGRRTIPIARYIKKQHTTCQWVQLMWPGKALECDLIIVPEHDQIRPQPNMFVTTGALHGINSTTLEGAKTQWESHLGTLPAPRVGVLLGGHSKSGRMQPEDATLLVDKAKIVAGHEGSVMITTSRRTPPACMDAIRPMLRPQDMLYDWRSRKANPYRGMLAWADALCVSGDSISMLSEAASTAKPVYVHAPAHLAGEKQRNLAARLVQMDYAHYVTDVVADGWMPAGYLQETERAADFIRQHLHPQSNDAKRKT